MDTTASAARLGKRGRNKEIVDLKSMLDDLINRFNNDPCIQHLTETYRLGQIPEHDLLSMMRHILDEVNIHIRSIEMHKLLHTFDITSINVDHHAELEKSAEKEAAAIDTLKYYRDDKGYHIDCVTGYFSEDLSNFGQFLNDNNKKSSSNSSAFTYDSDEVIDVNKARDDEMETYEKNMPHVFKFLKEVFGSSFHCSSVMDDNSSNNNSNSSSACAGGDDANTRNNRKVKMHNLTWLIVAAFLDLQFRGKYRSRYSFLTQVAIQLCKSTQTLASTLIYPLIPGSFSFSKVAKAIQQEAATMAQTTPVINLRKFLVNLCYDNTQTRPLKTTETGKGINKKEVTVRTMRILLKYFNPDPNGEVLKFIDIQFNQQHNPTQMAKTYPLASVPEKAMLIRDKSSDVVNGDMASANANANASGGGSNDASRSDSSRFPNLNNPEKTSDKEYLDFEFSFGLKLALDTVLKSDTWKFELRGDALKQLTKKQTEFTADLKSKQKICLRGCNNLAQNNNHWCRDCGADLPTMPEVELSKSLVGGLKVTPIGGGGGSSSNGNNQHAHISRFKSEKEMSDTANFFNQIPPSIFPINSFAVELLDEENDCDEQNTAIYEKEMQENGMTMERVVMALLDANPAEKFVQEKIQNEFMKEIGGLGSGLQGGVSQVFLTHDAGAGNIEKIIKDEMNNFIVLVGLGHTEMAVTRLVFRVANAVLGDLFIIAHDFQREGKGIDYLKSCKNNHKSWVFSQLEGISLNIELAKQFLLASKRTGTDYSEKNKGTIEEINAKFVEWVNSPSHSSDLLFTNAVFAAKLISASLLFRKAMRDKSGTGNAFAMDAALKFIIPLFYQCGFTKYAALMHWHLIRTNYRVTPLVAEAIRKLQIWNYQGVDFFIEEDIKRTAGGSSHSKSGSVIATSALALNQKSKFISQFRRKSESSALSSRRFRSLKNRQQDLAAFDVIHRENNLWSLKMEEIK